MEEEKDVLQVELEKVEEEEREERRKLEDTPLARILKKKAKVKAQIKERKIKDARKELEKATKANQKVSKAIDRHIAKKEEVRLASLRWDQERARLDGKLSITGEKERNARAKLKELETGEGEKVLRKEDPFRDNKIVEE